MFEAVILVCALAGGDCHARLVPGYEAAGLAGCAAALEARPAKGARCVPAGDALAVTQVAPGVFVHEGAIAEPDVGNGGDVANAGFVIGESSVAVIDSGGSRRVGEGLWRAVRAQTDLPVAYAILTHMHPDHVFGATVFAEAGAEVVGHARLPRALADRQANYAESFARLLGEGFADSVAPEVTMTVEGRAEIDLGQRVLVLEAWPPAHTATDLTVLDKSTNLLFAGDLVFDRHAPALDGLLTGWQAVLGELMARDLAGLVPGHGAARLDWPEGGEPLARYLDVLAADTRAAIAEGQRLGDAVQTIAAEEAQHWALFNAYNPRNATVAFTELEWE